MSSIRFDLTRYPIPNQLFINGEWVNGKAKNTQGLSSAVNDQVICKGKVTYQGYFSCLLTRVVDVHWADSEDVDRAVESAANGLRAWQAFSKVSGY